MSVGELLERSLAYSLGSVAGTKAVSLGRTTPCAEWNLEELLGHLDDSLDALYEGLTGGRIGLLPHADRVCGFRTRACAVLGAWAAGPPEDVLV
ncbi:MAG: TIGR03086 family protein, partial [Streptomyces sp.]|nr:TIGR03086 family protein [Streptomyces sp.]